MSRRSVIINSIVNYIATETSSVGFRGLKYLQDINEFPSFYIFAGDESRYHEGAGHKYSVISCSLRGYVHSETLNEVEEYARTLETAIQNYAKTNRNLVEEARVIRLGTDEGLMAPFGIIDMEVEILYEVN